LRTELFLPFRLAVRQIVEPQLSVKPKKIQEEEEGDYLVNKAFRHVFPSWIYYIEEEVSECDGPFQFDREGILKLIGKVEYSESMPKNCFKMVDYLSKLI